MFSKEEWFRLGLGAAIFFGLSVGSSVAQERIPQGPWLELSCQEKSIRLGIDSPFLEDVSIRAVLTLHPNADPGCTSDRTVQTTNRIVEGILPGTVRSLRFTDLGLEIPNGCQTYISSVHATALRGKGTATANCITENALSTLSTVDCSVPPVSTQIENDLLFSNKIDLQALGGSCLGLQEYVAHLRNRPDSTTTYKAFVEAKYICATNPGDGTSKCGPAPPDPEQGWNQGREPASGSATLAPGACLNLTFDRSDIPEEGNPTLPACCDLAGIAAVQCGSFTVTEVGNDVCSPPFTLVPEAISKDGATATFNCAFDPLREDTFPNEPGCFPDDDCDAAVENPFSPSCTGANDCDNCSGISNPSQADSDMDGIGDACEGACDNDGTCEFGENCESCANDCQFVFTAACGNGICETAPVDGEDCLSCPQDCNGKQKGSQKFCCGDGAGVNPVTCADSRCTTGGFSCTSTPAPCDTNCCGNGVCEVGPEDCMSCPQDCPSYTGNPPSQRFCCGNGVCQSAESATTCEADCAPPVVCAG